MHHLLSLLFFTAPLSCFCGTPGRTVWTELALTVTRLMFNFSSKHVYDAKIKRSWPEFDFFPHDFGPFVSRGVYPAYEVKMVHSI
jgi:hypothetical protein